MPKDARAEISSLKNIEACSSFNTRSSKADHSRHHFLFIFLSPDFHELWHDEYLSLH